MLASAFFKGCLVLALSKDFLPLPPRNLTELFQQVPNVFPVYIFLATSPFCPVCSWDKDKKMGLLSLVSTSTNSLGCH